MGTSGVDEATEVCSTVQSLQYQLDPGACLQQPLRVVHCYILCAAALLYVAQPARSSGHLDDKAVYLGLGAGVSAVVTFANLLNPCLCAGLPSAAVAGAVPAGDGQPRAVLFGMVGGTWLAAGCYSCW